MSPDRYWQLREALCGALILAALVSTAAFGLFIAFDIARGIYDGL